MKVTEQYAYYMIRNFKVVLRFESADKTQKCGHSNESLAAEQYFPVVLFIMMYKVGLTFESADEIQKCGHSNESC